MKPLALIYRTQPEAEMYEKEFKKQNPMSIGLTIQRVYVRQAWWN